MNFNILQREDGSGNWTSSHADLDALRQLAQWANGYFIMGGCRPSDSCPGVGYLTDTKIRLSLENIHFYQSTDLWNSTNTNAMLAVVHGAHPEARNQLNIFFSAGSFGNASGFASTPNPDHNYHQAVVMLRAVPSDGTGSNLHYAAAGTLVHEIGHVLGLYHSYAGGCCPETSDETSCDYLTDVFCPPTNPHPQDAGWACDPHAPASVNTCTNNMMGGVRDACLFTPLQIARMHRSLSVTSAQKYVKRVSCTPAPQSMSLWLPLDETAGSQAVNLGGPVGTHVGAPTKTAGRVAGALCFDGRSQYVDVPDYAGADVGNGNFAIEAWLRRTTDADSGVRVIAEKRVDSSALLGYSFFLYQGRLGFQLANGTHDNYVADGVVPDDGAWHHVAVSVNRVHPNGGLLYVDGAIALRFDPRKYAKSLDNASPLRIGATTLSPARSFFQGCIDEVAAYRRALSPAEVRALVVAGAEGRCKRSCTASSLSFPAGVASGMLEGRLCNATLHWIVGQQDAPRSETCTDRTLIRNGAEGAPRFNGLKEQA